MAESLLQTGAAAIDISPQTTQFLAGYPHVERWSTGIHDPLLSSALCLDDGTTRLLWIANDLVYVTKPMVTRVRRRLSEATGIPVSHILLSATHTHSGPRVNEPLCASADPALQPPDPAYVAFAEDGMVNAGCEAVANLAPAELGIGETTVRGIGTNRRAPTGPSLPQVPLLFARHAETHAPIALVQSVTMHPTVLHEDSTLVSGDFPGLARQQLQAGPLDGCPVLHLNGAAGNQSPRHAVKGNTFAEAERLGGILAEAVAAALPGLEFRRDWPLAAASRAVELPRRRIPDVGAALAREFGARFRLDHRRQFASRQEARTAECDWFGAEETLTLARLVTTGAVEAAIRGVMPAEVQVFRVGEWVWAAWAGEFFVEYALAVREARPKTAVVAYANGELQGYVVTEEAARDGGYEASNALFAPAAGQLVVETTLELLASA